MPVSHIEPPCVSSTTLTRSRLTCAKEKKRETTDWPSLLVFTKSANYSASFFAVFLAASFLAGFSSAGSSALAALAAFAGLASASREAFSSASAERSPRVVFSTFGRSSCGSAGAAFLAAFGAASLRSSHVRRCETRIRLASRLRISRHRV